jgi:hypothetical protein
MWYGRALYFVRTLYFVRPLYFFVYFLYIARFIYCTLFCPVYVISMGDGGLERGEGNLYCTGTVGISTVLV